MDSSNFVLDNVYERFKSIGLEAVSDTRKAISGGRGVEYDTRKPTTLPLVNKAQTTEHPELVRKAGKAVYKVVSNTSVSISRYRQELETKLCDIDKTAKDCFLECQDKLLKMNYLFRQTLEA